MNEGRQEGSIYGRKVGYRRKEGYKRKERRGNIEGKEGEY
jgi:hypothetical protein